MILKPIIVSFLFITGINLSFLPQLKINAQNPPAETYQPGFWQPVARVDLNRPINLKLINEANIGIDYALIEENSEPILIQPNNTVIFKNIQPSAYIVVYPDSRDPDNSNIYLRYNIVVTEDNVIEVHVKQTDDGRKSHRTFNLQETGAIYLY